MRSFSAFPGLQLASLACLVLTGCSLSPTAAPTADAGLAIQGKVMGGQQPIQGAHVYLFAANTTGYGGPGIAASTSNTSVSLLKAASTGFSDSVGAYVPTDSNGNFSITGDYSCTPNTQVYLYALGGNPGLAPGTNNTAAGLLAALGNCPSAGNFLTATPYIVINEVSTIATAYAFAGFATDETHVSSSGSALAQTGIANAFANATNLETLSTGVALATTPAGNGTVPQSTINTLADILAGCINTTGTVTGPTNATACYTLLANSLSGGTTGTQPTDTATAAINIAHNPAANIATRFGLQTATSPFQPMLNASPNDFTIVINFIGGGLDGGNYIAIDGSGNVWTNSIVNNITKFSPSGVALSGSSGFTGGGLNLPQGLAIDSFGNVWVANNLGHDIIEFNSAGTVNPNSPFTGGGVSAGAYVWDVAVDQSGHIWTSIIGYQGISNIGSLAEFNPPTSTWLSPSTGYTGGGLESPYGIAVDIAGDVWMASSVGGTAPGSIVEFNSNGTSLSGSSGYTGAGVSVPIVIAIDGSGNVWATSAATLGEFNSSGAPISPSTGYAPSGGNPAFVAIDGAGNAWTSNYGYMTIGEYNPSGDPISGSNGYKVGAESSGNGAGKIAIDGSGNVWVPQVGKGLLSEFVGAATPVVTPIVANLLAPYGSHAVNKP